MMHGPHCQKKYTILHATESHLTYVSAGVIGTSVTIWANIDPNLLLYVFLPPLIFGEAMSLNFHHVQGGFLQSVLLAGPGVVIGMHLMLFCVRIVVRWRCMFTW